jgi:hypothetical protein
VRVADHHVRDVAAAVDEHADLAAGLARELGQLAREVVGDEALGGQAAAREALDALDLIGFESRGLAGDADVAAPAGPASWPGSRGRPRRGEDGPSLAPENLRSLREPLNLRVLPEALPFLG